MNKATVNILYEEISSRIISNTTYIENRYPLMVTCNMLVNYYYKSPELFKNYFVSRIYNRINRENKINSWEDIYKEELALLEEDCFKYKKMISQCLNWDGKLLLPMILSLCAIMLSVILIVWVKYPNAYLLLIISSVSILVSMSPHYYAKRLIKRKSVIDKFIIGATVKKVEKSIEPNKKHLEKIFIVLFYTLSLLEQKNYVTAFNKNNLLYNLYSRYKSINLENVEFKFDTKEFFILLTTLISAKNVEGRKPKGQKNTIAIFNLKCSHKDLYNLVYEILNKEKTASINSYKTELSKGFNRILFACVNDLHAIDKKYRMTLLSDLLTKTS